MKKLLIFITFLVAFILSSLIFMPYEKIYGVVIDSLAQKGRVGVSYSIKKASPTYVELMDLKLVMPNKTISIDRCKIKFHPLGLLLNTPLINISIDIGDENGTFSIKKKSNRLYIDGMFKTAMLSYFLNNQMSSFIKGFRGTDTVNLILTYGKHRIVIDRLKVSGDFELTARGYIKSGVLRLMGVVKIGKIKENFSI